jgi:hypothetical protein
MSTTFERKRVMLKHLFRPSCDVSGLYEIQRVESLEDIEVPMPDLLILRDGQYDYLQSAIWMPYDSHTEFSGAGRWGGNRKPAEFTCQALYGNVNLPNGEGRVYTIDYDLWVRPEGKRRPVPITQIEAEPKLQMPTLWERVVKREVPKYT